MSFIQKIFENSFKSNTPVD